MPSAWPPSEKAWTHMHSFGKTLGRTIRLTLIVVALAGCAIQSAAQEVVTPLGPISAPGMPASEAPTPTATPTPAPVVLPAGATVRPLMEGTPQETPLYLIGSGEPG